MSELEPTITKLEPTATERLRALLDERGVEWWPMYDVENGYHQDRDTEFVIDGKKYTAHEWGGTLNVYGLTPEQAIAATLGSCNCSNSERTGTCRNVHEPPRNTTFWPTPHFKCSECGEVHVSMQYVYFCPNCGRKVVDDG